MQDQVPQNLVTFSSSIDFDLKRGKTC